MGEMDNMMLFEAPEKIHAPQVHKSKRPIWVTFKKEGIPASQWHWMIPNLQQASGMM